MALYLSNPTQETVGCEHMTFPVILKLGYHAYHDAP